MKRLVVGILTVLSTLAVALPAASVFAASASAQSAAPGGGHSNLTYLFAAYTVVFVALAAYLFYMARRQRELDREVRALRRALQEKEQEGAGR